MFKNGNNNKMIYILEYKHRNKLNKSKRNNKYASNNEQK